MSEIYPDNSKSESPKPEIKEPGFVKYETREAWLNAAVALFRPRFTEVGYPVPEKLRITVGFGPTGAKAENATILGTCLHTACTDDDVNEIFISPEHASSGVMLGTVLHELIHAALNNEDGHKGRFAEAATRLGLNGPMTATTPGLDLLIELETIVVTELGSYPGSRVDFAGALAKLPVGPDGRPLPRAGGKPSSGPGKQTTRMRKVACDTPDCACGGYTVRTTAKWLEIGLPKCPMGNEMMEQ